MPFNKISGGSNIPPTLPVSLGPGETFMLPVGQGVVGTYGGVLSPQIATNNPLSGQYLLQLGQYTQLQVFDGGLNYWRSAQVNPYSFCTVSADGYNYRLANTTGCPIGVLITGGGTNGQNGFYGYASLGDPLNLPPNGNSAVTIINGFMQAGNTSFTITPSAGSSLWNAIIGGAVNTTLSVSGTVYQNGAFGGTGNSSTASAGSGYTRPPLIVFAPPPNQGIQPYILPTAVCSISSGAINSVTILNQGAGLLGLPQITVVPQPGDTTGGGAVLGWLSANSAQVGSGSLTAMWPVYYGTPLTAVPTFTFGGAASPAPTVTAIMNFSVTGFTQTTAGAGYVAANGVFGGGIVSGTAAFTNPVYDKALSIPIFPPVTVTAASGLPALAGPFGGVNIQSVPTFSSFSTGAAPSTAAVTTVNVGGQNDTAFLITF